MRTLDAAQIRASFTNVSLRERKAVAIPDLDAVAWDDIDYLGWRDPKMPSSATSSRSLTTSPSDFSCDRLSRLRAVAPSACGARM